VATAVTSSWSSVLISVTGCERLPE